MKRIMAIMLTVALILSLSACGVVKRGEMGADEERMTVSIDTIYDSICFSNADEKSDSAGTIDLIVSLEDVDVRHLRGTFTVDNTDNSRFSASFLMEIESDGGMIKLDNPIHQYFECNVENGKITEIRRLDDGKVSMTFCPD